MAVESCERGNQSGADRRGYEIRSVKRLKIARDQAVQSADVERRQELGSQKREQILQWQKRQQARQAVRKLNVWWLNEHTKSEQARLTVESLHSRTQQGMAVIASNRRRFRTISRITWIPTSSYKLEAFGHCGTQGSYATGEAKKLWRRRLEMRPLSQLRLKGLGVGAGRVARTQVESRLSSGSCTASGSKPDRSKEQTKLVSTSSAVANILVAANKLRIEAAELSGSLIVRKEALWRSDHAAVHHGDVLTRDKPWARLIPEGLSYEQACGIKPFDGCGGQNGRRCFALAEIRCS